MAMTAWSAKVSQQRDLPVGEGPDLGPRQTKPLRPASPPGAGDADDGPEAADPLILTQLILGIGTDIEDMDWPPFEGDPPRQRTRAPGRISRSPVAALSSGGAP